MDYAKIREAAEKKIIAKNRACLRNIEGEFRDEVNWMTGEGIPNGLKTVDVSVEDQGKCSICWALSSIRATESELKKVGRSEQLSVQDAIDHCYPGCPGCRGGHPSVVLEWLKKEGVSSINDYPRPFDGFKPPNTPPRSPVDRRIKIEGWSPVKDDEVSMKDAARKHVLVVTVPMTNGFMTMSGEEGLFDFQVAARLHNKSEMQALCDPSVPLPDTNYHSLILFGFGTFYPDSLFIEPINYWRLKNTWGDFWGHKGFVNPIRNSSLSAPSAPCFYFPVHPIATFPNEVYVPSPPLITRVLDGTQLVRWLNHAPVRKNALLCFVYNSGVIDHQVFADRIESMISLELFCSTHPNILILRVDMCNFPNLPFWCNFGLDMMGTALLAYKPTQIPGLHTERDHIVFPPLAFTFPNILNWITDVFSGMGLF